MFQATACEARVKIVEESHRMMTSDGPELSHVQTALSHPQEDRKRPRRRHHVAFRSYFTRLTAGSERRTSGGLNLRYLSIPTLPGDYYNIYKHVCDANASIYEKSVP